MCLQRLNEAKLQLDSLKILEFLSNDRIGQSPKDFAKLDPNTSFYFFDGPNDEKTRQVCQKVLVLGKFYTQEELDYLSGKIGFDVTLYGLGYNCRHQFKRARIKGKLEDGFIPDTPTKSTIRSITKTEEN